MTQQRFVLIGHPVAHSISPAMHGAAYRACGWSHTYTALDCPDEAAVRVVADRIRRGDLDGANVTVPWKRVALALADEPSPRARKIGAANVLLRGADGGLVADNTDVLGLVDEWRGLRGAAAPALRTAYVLGAGGAALAAIVAAQELGARQVLVTSRSWVGADRAGWRGASDVEALGAELTPWPSEGAPQLHEAAASMDLVVQCTSAGMHGAAPGEPVAARVPWEDLPPEAIAYDVVYNPPVTPFLVAAERADVRVAGGLGMLIGQALAAVELWVGERPPREPMLAAARSALFGSAEAGS